MIIDIDPELLMSMVLTVNESLVVVEALVDGDNPDAAGSALRAAQAAAAGLSIIVGGWVGGGEGDGGDDAGGTDDPATCTHPATFPPPADKLCTTCGATYDPDTNLWVPAP